MACNHPLLVWDLDTSEIYVGFTDNWYMYSLIPRFSIPWRRIQYESLRFCTTVMLLEALIYSSVCPSQVVSVLHLPYLWRKI